MKILWIVNILFPEVSESLYGTGTLKSTGGWLLSAANKLVTESDSISLCIVTVSNKVKDLTKLCGKKILYYVIPYGSGNTKENNEYDYYMQKIYKDFLPDVVHIHGTEFSQGLSYINACGNTNVVLSIQGLSTAISEYYTTGLTFTDILYNHTLFDFVKTSVWREKHMFAQKGKYENKIISNCKYIIGRTDWDRARIWNINPKAKYFICNEILRDEFYDGMWEYEKCDKHTIFLSQATYPVKGLHVFLKALPKIREHFPDLKVRIAGKNILETSSLKQKLLFTGYAKYIRKLIKKLRLEDIIFYTGPLDASAMKAEYLKANVFVSPSIIENSPNSIGEAQILGVPIVSSYVGGVSTMIPDDSYGYKYRSDEYSSLAYYICHIFHQRVFSNTNMIQLAKHRHDARINTKQLLNIYNQIIQNI